MISKIKVFFLELLRGVEPERQPALVLVEQPYLLTNRVPPRRRDPETRPRGLFSNKYKYQID